MRTQFNYANYQEQLCALEKKTRQLLKNTGNTNLADSMDAELEVANERKELKLAFVGQYSSGKSTIISALTGRKDIKIDANISTDIVSEYKWNNIVLMDTPGILAGKNETHDSRTKAALKECDLIFYVLTSSLFDDVLFNNFIDLAYNQHFADKMFLVINKMGLEYGNFEQLAANYTCSLEKIFSAKGYDLGCFPIAFIDAYDYISGIEDNDDDFIRISNFEHFIDMLNVFINRKGLIKKQFDTPIRIMQSYLKNIEVSEVNKTLSDFYNQYEQKLVHSQIEVKRDVMNILYSFDSTSMNEIINLSNQIGAIDENEWKINQDNLNEKLRNIITETSRNIEECINQNYERLLNEMNEFGEKESLVMYYDSLNQKISSPNISIEEKKSLNTQKKCLELLKTGASKVGSMAPNVNNVFGGISAASSSSLHEIVLNVGHFFGKSFKPWEAVRWASNIAKVAKFGIPIVTAGIDIWLQFREDKKENERLEQIKNSKSIFITNYQTEVNRVKSSFENYLNLVLENYANKRNEINRSKDELIRTSKRNENISRSIKELDSEYVDFIEIINKE